MKVLVACEFSGIVRDAFRDRGHNAWSCDLLLCEGSNKYHIQRDIMEEISDPVPVWDMMIAHPPCTHLAVSGAMHFHRKQKEQAEALDFVRALLDAPIERIALENPVSVISTRIRKPDQIIQPWMFGHPEQKKTCLWLKNLPPLVQTDNVYDEMMALPKNKRERLHYLGPSKDRWRERSRTFLGIAKAMAEQWG